MALENTELTEPKGSVKEIDLSEPTKEAIDDKGETSEDSAIMSLDDLEAVLDGVTEEEDNNTEAGIKPEETSLDTMRDSINQLVEDNKRLTRIVSKLVLNHGARMGAQNSEGIEAFRETSVEPKLPSEGLNLSGVPGLDEIQLG